MSTLPPIALCGQLRAGKDAVGAYLSRKYGYVRVAFGDGIREITRRLYPDQYTRNTKPRALLQGVGQALRAFDENVWVRDYFRRIDELQIKRNLDADFFGRPRETITPACTDLRQPNEYEALRAAGYVIIRVTAPEEVRLDRARAAGDAFEAADLAHETESHANGFEVDYEIENADGLEELRVKIDYLVRQIAV